MGQFMVSVDHINVGNSGASILDDINFTIKENQQWAFTGPSGSGKTTLARVLAGKIFAGGSVDFSAPGQNTASPSVVLIEQQHRFKTLSNTSDFYYQQRFNSFDSEDAATVRNYLGNYSDPNHWLELLHIFPLMDEPLIQLSNGENKRLQIALALLENPDVILFDSPFTGLDTEGRGTLNQIIDIISAKRILVILFTNTNEFPSCITHVAELNEGKLVSVQEKEGYLNRESKEVNIVLPGIPPGIVSSFSNIPATIIDMKAVYVRYGNKTILDNIYWQVKKGECWSVSGPNGAGKSTLLSLITADNPQAYANDIYLFGRKRGSGESIWDIKRNIGYVSPELHLYFEQGMNCFQVIASGLFDTIGLFRQLSEEQETITEEWIRLFSLEHLKHKSLQQLSLGQQRKVLLARALIKNPPLLVLDEPCQGLDEQQTRYFSRFVDHIYNSFGTTILYVSHYHSDLPNCIQHFLRLREGRRLDNGQETAPGT